MAVGTATPPTTDQLRAYAGTLPDIYRDVLVTFTAAHGREAGEAIPFGTIRNTLLNGGKSYTDVQLYVALGHLEGAGLVRDVRGMEWFAPTLVGEELVTVLTGVRPAPPHVPDLPQPPW